MNRDEKSLFGLNIASLTLNDVASKVISLISVKGKKQIYYINAHCLVLASQNSHYKKILQKASLVYSGGIGPILASYVLGKPLKQRTPTPDFINTVFDKIQNNNLSVYLIGSTEESINIAVSRIKHKFNKLNIIGFHSGYFSKKKEAIIITEINRLKPTVLLVGMGPPKQELWIDQNFKNLDVKIFWAVGALFDVISNTIPRAPKWMRMLGLEWLHRLIQEPRRLWRRYTLGIIKLLILTLRELYKSQLRKPY